MPRSARPCPTSTCTPTTRRRWRAGSTTWRCCPATWSGPCGSSRTCVGFPLTEVQENRDYPGSTHFFFDTGNGNALAYFDLPGLDLGEYAEVLGGLHHLAISITREQWEAARARLADAGVEHAEESGTSLYFRGPDGERLELLAEPLGTMYGERVV